MLALKIAKESNAELHMICVEEIEYLPEAMEDVRQETGVAGRRFHSVVNRARSMAEEAQVKLKGPRRRRPSRARHRRPRARSQDRSARGRRQRPLRAL